MDRLTKGNKAICEPSLTCPHDEADRAVIFKKMSDKSKHLFAEFLGKAVPSLF